MKCPSNNAIECFTTCEWYEYCQSKVKLQNCETLINKIVGVLNRQAEDITLIKKDIADSKKINSGLRTENRTLKEAIKNAGANKGKATVKNR